jgi:hypothetical protein
LYRKSKHIFYIYFLKKVVPFTIKYGKNFVQPDRLMTRPIDAIAIYENAKNDSTLLQTIHKNIRYIKADAYVSNVAAGTRKDTSTLQDADRRPH